jgi:hypothetical protein
VFKSKEEQYIIELRNVVLTGMEEISRVMHERKLRSDEEWGLAHAYTQAEVFVAKLNNLEKELDKNE